MTEAATNHAGAPAVDLRMIPLANLVESKTNPRRAFDDVFIGELADSIRRQGVLHPITVRRSQANGRADLFEVVAGACRFRAAKRAKLAHVPAIVRTLSDEQSLEIQIIENLQRRDIAPLDEAHGFKQLIDVAGMTPKQIAERVVKSQEYVYARIKLLDAGAPVQKALAESKIKAEQATILARLPAKEQSEGLAKCTASSHPATVQQLRQWAKEKDDDAKRQARVQGEISKAKAAGQKVVEISLDSYTSPPAGTLKPEQYAVAGKSKCDHLALGFVREHAWTGSRREWHYEGGSVKVCLAPSSCPVHKRPGTERTAPRKKTPAQLLAARKERAKAIATKRAIAAVVAKADTNNAPALLLIARAFAGAVWRQKIQELIERRGWKAPGWNIGPYIANKAKAMSRRELQGLLVDLTITEDPDTLPAFAKLTGVGIPKLERQALAELQPKAKAVQTSTAQKTKAPAKRKPAKRKK